MIIKIQIQKHFSLTEAKKGIERKIFLLAGFIAVYKGKYWYT
jgi:hypothetical protein